MPRCAAPRHGGALSSVQYHSESTFKANKTVVGVRTIDCSDLPRVGPPSAYTLVPTRPDSAWHSKSGGLVVLVQVLR